MKDVSFTVATRGKLITKTGFKNYDICLNTYVGCQFGCTYCYVRFFIKDKDKEWGKFVRLRHHVADKLPKELPAHAGKRMVMGTMTDPYQPAERKHRITRKALKIITTAPDPLSKVGIFTRSPIVLEDLELITQLPRARVHFTITPVRRKDLILIEPVAIAAKRRFETVKALKDAGLRVHVNVSPAIPILSDDLVDEYVEKLAEMKVDEFFVDPMQAYNEAFLAMGMKMQYHPDWPEISATMQDKERYAEWKQQYREVWTEKWKKSGSKNTLPIWSDHENKTWVDMRTGEQMDIKRYGDDLYEDAP